MVRFLTVGGRPTAVRADFLPQRLVFLAYKYEGFVGCFLQDFKWIFTLVLLTLSRGFLHLYESKYFQSKGEFIKSVLEVIFLKFSSTISILVFSHNT